MTEKKQNFFRYRGTVLDEQNESRQSQVQIYIETKQRLLQPSNQLAPLCVLCGRHC